MSTSGDRNDREFARISVRIRARFRILDETEAAEARRKTLDEPSVWAPTDEETLVNLASSSQSHTEGVLARTILDVCGQLQRLSYRVLDSGGPMETADLVQLSGSGARLATRPILEKGAILDLQMEDDDTGAPPLRLVAEVVHAEGEPPARYGLRFTAIHPLDQKRLIRYLYRLQRKALRETHMDNG